MRQPTEQQIKNWTADLVALERARLPYGHPNRSHIGGGALSETRRRANNARERLTNHGRLPSKEQLRTLAEQRS